MKKNLFIRVCYSCLAGPSLAPIWYTTQRSSATEIQLEWNALSLEQARGHITEYTVRYGQSVNNCTTVRSVSDSSVGHNQHSLLLNDLNPQSDYCAAIAASTTAGVGVYSEWIHITGMFGFVIPQLYIFCLVYKRKILFFAVSGIQNCYAMLNVSLNKF